MELENIVANTVLLKAREGKSAAPTANTTVGPAGVGARYAEEGANNRAEAQVENLLMQQRGGRDGGHSNP